MTLRESVSPGGGIWAEVAGQPKVVAQLSKAAKSARALIAHSETLRNTEKETGTRASTDETASSKTTALPRNTSSMTHAWLIVGPPGSGRSTAATAFAAALECSNPDDVGCGVCAECRAVRKGNHPDVTVMATDLVQVTIAEIKELVQAAYQRPVRGAWRIIIVEDYDRLTEASSNTLLKALEEPPERTVWLLCAPSASAVIPTVRSRCRLVQLALPTPETVADLLVRRDGIEDPELAAQVAAESGAHIGRARALARDPELRERRNRMLEMVAGMRTSSDACWTAAALVKLVKLEAAEMRESSDAEERAELLRTFGLDAEIGDSRLPKDLKTQLKRLEETQERRHRRLELDTWDRLLEDLGGFYRDVMLAELGAHSTPHNRALAPVIARLTESDSDAKSQVNRLEAIRHARSHLMHNGNPTLTLEALCLDLLARNNEAFNRQ